MTITTGKSGIVRRTGKDLEKLRLDCFKRDKYTCTCGCGRGAPSRLDMAHIKSRGSGGSDVISNVRTLLHECHMKEHNAGGKPCPPKPKSH